MENLTLYVDSFRLQHERFLLGCESVEEMGLWDKEALGEMDAFYSNELVSVIIRLIAADGKITSAEVQYLNETFGFDYTREELAQVYDACKEDLGHSFDENFENGITLMRKINAKLADAYKELLCLICRIIAESDGAVVNAEVAEARRLQALCE